jgi:poly-beta-1,6-N-acetyl-D-glucosamine synthase
MDLLSGQVIAKVVFWSALALLAFTYIGYLLLMEFWARIRPQPVSYGDPIGTRISFVIAARNEADKITAKLENLSSLGLAKEATEVIVVSDGSDDGTADVASKFDPGVNVIVLAGRNGKAVALNTGIRAATGDIIVFTDARQKIERGAVEKLISALADQAVGSVSGALVIGELGARSNSGESTKMDIENRIRAAESACGSCVGVTGAFYAARRELIPEIPAGTILDDMYVPLSIIKSGYRNVFVAEARAWDPIQPIPGQEFRRKVRTLVGNYQLMSFLPWLTTFQNPALFRFLGHKAMRLLSPFLLLIALVTNILLAPYSDLFKVLLILQLFGYSLALLDLMRVRIPGLKRVQSLASTFALLNVAAIVAYWNAIRGEMNVWSR